MSTSAIGRSSGLKTYARVTRSGTYGFLAALPLFVAYEVLILLVNEPGPTAVRVGADVWIKQALAWVGADRMFWVSLVVLAVGAAIVWVERKKRITLRPAWFGWMLLESVVYALVVALAVSTVVSGLFYGAVAPTVGHSVAAFVPGAPLDGLPLSTMLALSLGAGLYEELVFRVFLVTGLAWMLTRLGTAPGRATVVAALVGALLFSAVHYVGAYGDPFTLASFTFRFLFGLALNGLYVARGFGIAAWTHALYDVFVVTGALG